MDDKTADGVSYRRTLNTIVEDMPFPFLVEPKNRRQLAIAEVFRRIPDGDYRVLGESVDRWDWFIPDTWMRGFIRRWPAGVYPKKHRGGGLSDAPYVDMVYLAPKLETTAWSIVVAIVAHEMAHLVLGHKLLTSPGEYEAQEAAAFDRICKWGFRKEAVLHRAGLRRRDSLFNKS